MTEHKFPGLKATELTSLNDPRVLHMALFNACKELVGVDPTWSPHLKFRELYQQAVLDLKAVDENPCYVGGFILEDPNDQ